MGAQQGFPFTPPREKSVFEKLLERIQNRGLWQSFLEFEEPLSSGLVRGATLGLLGGEPLRLLPRPEEPGPYAQELGEIGEAAGALAPMFLSGGVAEAALPARLAGAGRTAAVGAASFALPELGREALEGELHPERLAREATIGAAFGLPGRVLPMLGVGGAELAFGGTPAQAILGALLAGVAGGHKPGGVAEAPPVEAPVEPAGLLPARFPVTREERLRNAAARGRPGTPRWPEAAVPPPTDRVAEILPKAIDWRESSFKPVEARIASATKPAAQLEILAERGATPAAIQAIERIAQAPTSALEEVMAQGTPEQQKIIQAAIAVKKGAYIPDGAPAINRLPEAAAGVKIVPMPDVEIRTELDAAMEKLRASGPEGETRATALKDLHDEAAATQQRYARENKPVPPEVQRSFEIRQEEIIQRPTRFSTPQQAFTAAQRQVRTYKTPAEVDEFLAKLPDHFGLEESAKRRLREGAKGYKRALTESVTLRDVVKQRQAAAGGSSGDSAFDARLGEHGLTARSSKRGIELMAGGQTVRRFKEPGEARAWLDGLADGSIQPTTLPELQALAHRKGVVTEMINADAIRLTNQLTGEAQTFGSLADATEALAGHPPLEGPDLIPLAAEDPHFPQTSNLGSQAAGESRLPLCSGPWQQERFEVVPEHRGPAVRRELPKEYLGERLSGRAIQYDLERTMDRAAKAFDPESVIGQAVKRLPEEVRAQGTPGRRIERPGKPPSGGLYYEETPQAPARVHAPTELKAQHRERILSHESLGHGVYARLPRDVQDEWRRLMTDYGVVHRRLKANLGKGKLYERVPPDRLANENFAYFMEDFMSGALTRAARAQRFGPRTPSALALDFIRTHGGKI